MADSFLVGWLAATVSAATPLTLAAMGEIVAERSGVLNLGVEGMMLVGALAAFATTAVTGNLYLGFLAGIAAGTAMAAVHAVLSISLNADQVISGVMLTLLGTGLTTYLGGPWTARQITGFPRVTLPVVGGALVRIPVVGDALFSHTVPDFLTLLAVPVVWYLLFRTNVGLEITAVGDDPETADTMGIDVRVVRYACVLTGGAFAGAAGADLSLAFSKLWAANMVAGRGWIVIALVIFAQWRPGRALAGAYLFGSLDALQIRSQAVNIPALLSVDPVSRHVLEVVANPVVMSTYPYLITVVMLVLISRGGVTSRLSAPSALAKPYRRESG